MLDLVHHLVHSSHFLAHQVAEHLVFSIEIIGNQSGGSMGAVGGAESVVNVVLTIAGKGLGELFL